MSGDGYERCVMCGEPIPEGGQICAACEHKCSLLKKNKEELNIIKAGGDMKKTTDNPKKRNYYDIDEEFMEVLVQGGMLSDMFYLKDLQSRKLFLNSEVEPLGISELVRHIMQINADDKGIAAEERKPILLYITSFGGSVDAGFELIDIIENSITPVYTINLGYQYSMGFLIGLAGHKRFATKNAKYLMHDGSNFIYNSGSKVQDQIEFQRRVEQRIKTYVLDKTSITEEEYDANMRVEWYMFADEAKEKNITDCIIGKDCSLNDII